eukprot:3102453-Rhodomonas_salina.1
MGQGMRAEKRRGSSSEEQWLETVMRGTPRPRCPMSVVSRLWLSMRFLFRMLRNGFLREAWCVSAGFDAGERKATAKESVASGKESEEARARRTG